MLGTSSAGGVASVIRIYRETGLFDRWPIKFIATHTDIDASKGAKILVALKSFGDFFRLLVTGRVKIVHVHTSSRGSFWRKSCFILPAVALKRPVIFHLHSGEFDRFYHDECGVIAKSIVRYVLNHSTRIVVLSGYWRNKVSEISKNPSIVPILNPIEDMPAVDESLERDPATLLYLGRLVESKGIYLLLDAVAKTCDEFPDLRLLCAGSGDTEKVKAAAEELGIAQRVELLGWVEGDAKQALLESSTIFLLPSFAEGLPMSVLESMAAGLPVIATRVGGIPDVLADGSEGLIVPPGDAAALAKAIRLLLGDEKLRTEMESRSRQRFLREFRADITIPQVESLYRELGACPKEIGSK